MNIMPTRYQQLAEAVQGYQQTGFPLVAVHGARPYPAGMGDDFGIYYFIPKLAVLFGLPVERAIDLFFYGAAAFALIAGLTGFFSLYRQWNQRLVTLFVLLGSSFYAVHTGDVYIFSFFIAAAVVPWVILATRGSGGFSACLIFVLAAFFCTAVNAVRSHAGTAPLVFTIILLFASLKARAGRKAVILALMIVAALGVHLFFSRAIDERNGYLSRHDAAVEIRDGKHPFWHSVYIGFGFLSNPYVEKYLDEVAIEKVRSINPEARFLSSEYADILRRETMKIVREHPKFFIMNLAAKTGVIALYGVLFMNIGLVASRTRKMPLPVAMAFWTALSLNALFGLLVVPYPNYLFGFIAFASLYCVVSVNHGLEGGTLRALLKEMFSGKRLCAE